MEINLDDMRMTASIANAIIGMIEMVLNGMMPVAEPLSAEQTDNLHDTQKTARNIQIEASGIVVSRQERGLAEIYERHIQELISLCHRFIQTFTPLQKEQNKELNELVDTFTGYAKNLPERLEWVRNRSHYVHGLLSIAGMYGPLGQIARNVNNFLMENHYQPTSKNNLIGILDECNKHLNLLNDLVFNQRIDAELFRQTCIDEVKEWKKVRKKLQVNLDSLINLYKLDAEVVLTNYGALQAMPLELDVNKYL